MASKTKQFNSLRRGEQVLFLFATHGPMTIWELFDKFQKKLPNEQVTYENLRKLLLGMQKQHKAGIVNYKQEVKRQKLQRNSYYNRYNRRTEREYRHPLNYGQPLRGLAGLTVHVVEVWTAENNA